MKGLIFLLRPVWILPMLLVFFASISNLVGQVIDGDKNFITSYSQIIPYFPEVHAGSQYVQQDRHVDGHPFYNNQLIGMGTISIGGFNYSEVPLQYDIVKDMVITVTPVKNQKSILDPDKIERFTLGDSSSFVKVKQEIASFYHGNGFYREIIGGDIGLYCKHYKEIVKDSSPMTPYNSFYENLKFYIFMDNDFYPVRTRKDAFSLLQVTKREVRSEVKKNRLKFKKHKEAYIKVLVNKALETRMSNE